LDFLTQKTAQFQTFKIKLTFLLQKQQTLETKNLIKELKNKDLKNIYEISHIMSTKSIGL
jgi:hypothetical protein